MRVSNGRQERRVCEWSDSFHSSDLPTDRMGLKHGIDLPVKAYDPGFECPKLRPEIGEHLPCQGRQRTVLRFQERRQPSRYRLGRPRKHDPIFVQESPDLINECGSLCNEPAPHLVQELDVLLGDLLDRHKAHGGPGYRFGNRFRIVKVIFICFHIGFQELGCHELHPVPSLHEDPCPMVGGLA